MHQRMKKIKLRYKRTWFDEPPKIESGAYKFQIENIDAVGDRVNHWPGYGRDDSFYEFEEEGVEYTPEYTGTLGDRQSLCLKDINALVKEHNLNEQNVFFTASFSDDYLSIEVVHIKKQNKQEQLENYKQEYSNWAKQENLNKEEELSRIQQEIEFLQRKLKDLK